MSTFERVRKVQTRLFVSFYSAVVFKIAGLAAALYLTKKNILKLALLCELAK
jgi:hypothetical protein